MSDLQAKKSIALVAHDAQKGHLLQWVKAHAEALKPHTLYATGTTGHLLSKECGLDVHCLESGPLGGDQQIGALIVEGKINCLIFFWDPLEMQPHDPDVKALLRLANVWNIPMACNESTADFLISSPLIQAPYPRRLPDVTAYRNRNITISLDNS